jgi:AbrB family looped-hinge helix DNA binding protein
MEAAYVTTKGQLVIPAKIRRKLGIKRGTKVYFVERGNEVLFQPVTKVYVRGMCGVFKSTSSLTAELLKERARDKEREETKFKKLRAR